MSIDILGPVLYLSLEAHQKLVLAALADNANEDGICWPSQTTLALKASISERSVRDHIKLLESQGWLHVMLRGNGRGNPTHYALNTEKIYAEAQKARETLKAEKAEPQKQKAELCDIKAELSEPPNRHIEPSSLEPSYTKGPEQFPENLGGSPPDPIRVKPLLKLLRTFPFWRAADDGVWLADFLASRPWFDIEEAKKLRDYHMAKGGTKRRNWRLAMRNWREPYGVNSGAIRGDTGRRTAAAGGASYGDCELRPTDNPLSILSRPGLAQADIGPDNPL